MEKPILLFCTIFLFILANEFCHAFTPNRNINSLKSPYSILNAHMHTTEETAAEGNAIAKFPLLTEILDECEALNNVRFVVVGNGAILESVGKFTNLRYTEGKQGLLGWLICNLRIFLYNYS
jgi:hypothetical protein